MLNQDQNSAYTDVLILARDPKRKYHFISGGAGTGKTYLIGHIVKNLLNDLKGSVHYYGVQVTATTNKAVAVLTTSILNVALDAKTVHSFLSLKLTENYRTGVTKCTPTPNWQVFSNIVIIIDECSMINAELMRYIDKATDNTCRILFVGDKNQLAPVKELISPIYSNNFSASYLKTPVRNAGQQALVDLCEQAKQTVLTDVFNPIVEVPGIIDFLDDDGMKAVLEQQYTTEREDRRILCYTNKRVIQYNDYVRKLKGYTGRYAVGELVLNNSAIKTGKKSEGLYTDQLLKILSVGKVYEDTQLASGETVELVDLELEDVLSSQNYSVTTFNYPEDRAELIRHHGRVKDWSRYFDIKNNYPDLRNISASTTHKGQGSTYESVIVDLTDIGKCTNRDQTARMQYVALSRPKNHIYIYGKLPERYFQ